jgi:epoxyqueuosine reductase
MNNPENHSQILKRLAYDLGFSFVGISKAERLTEEEKPLIDWLDSGLHGEMSYMANHFDKRLDPTLLEEGTKSVVSLMYNYYSETKQADNDAPKISSYAYGEDYHFVIKDKLKSLLHQINESIGTVHGRVFVDSAPILERAWAKKSGLGWIGKNSMLINKTQGSFFFLAEMLLDIPLQPDGPIKDYCGTCTKCIDACPTNAIIGDRVVDGSKCISYLTIELKDEIIPSAYSDQMDNWMFGCDICQEVCPWNRFSANHNEERFKPKEELLNMTKEEWIHLNESTFKVLFKNSAVKRTKFKGLKRNIDFIKPFQKHQ